MNEETSAALTIESEALHGADGSIVSVASGGAEGPSEYDDERCLHESYAIEMEGGAESHTGSDPGDGATDLLETVADFMVESEGTHGPVYSHYRDPITQWMGILASEWDMSHKDWMGTTLRQQHVEDPVLHAWMGKLAADKKTIEIMVGEKLKKALRQHPIWPWLKQFKGLGGMHTARIISMIRDPLRFPGRPCDLAHISPEDWDGPCQHKVKVGDEWKECGLPLRPRRRGTGVRPLWHYLGLHVIDGKMPRKQKGVKCTWRGTARGAICQPEGLREQIERHMPQPYRGIYDQAKARLAAERAGQDGYPPIRIRHIAQIIAVKAFLGDLLIAWKETL